MAAHQAPQSLGFSCPGAQPGNEVTRWRPAPQPADVRQEGQRGGEFVPGKAGETISSSAPTPLSQVSIKPPQVCPAHRGLTRTGSLVPCAENIPIHVAREPGSPQEVPGAGNGRHRSQIACVVKVVPQGEWGSQAGPGSGEQNESIPRPPYWPQSHTEGGGI